MKKNYKSILLSLFLFFPAFLFSQVTLENLNRKQVKKFTTDTLTFVLPDYYPLFNYEDVLREVWNASPYKVVLMKNFPDSELKEDQNYVIFRNYAVETRGAHIKGAESFHVLEFNTIDRVKTRKNRTKWNGTTVGKIYFSPDIDIREQIMQMSYKDLKGELMNFRLGYLKNYFQYMNKLIKKGKSLDLKDDFKTPEIKNLKKDTLYIDKNFLYTFDIWKKGKKEINLEELMEDYDYPYEIVDYDIIEEKIIGKQPSNFYYLVYHQVNSRKIISVINGRTGDVVYQENRNLGYIINSNDLKRIGKAVKRS